MGTIIYTIGKLLAWLIFYGVFYSLFHFKKYYLPGFILVSFLSEIFLKDYSYLITFSFVYIVLWHHKKWNLTLINTLLLSSLIRLIYETLADTIIADKISTHVISGILLFVVASFLIKVITAIVFIFLYKRFDIEEKWQIDQSSLLSILLIYLFIAIYIFMHFIQENKAYSDLTIGVFAFIIIQCVFIAVLFGKASQTQQLAYKRELTKEQLKNLKMYTDQLEKDHLHLREFEHSYKDGIATLRSVAGDGDYTAMKQALEKLEVYSNGYFDNISMQLFKDLNNVQNSYLKSLFISKLTLIHQDNIKCHFECRNVIEDIDINIFDLVRLLGISIDNAIEATKGQTGAQIQIAIVKEKQQLSFLINNTIHSETKIQTMMQEGFTTKKNHSGLGMVNVQDIKKKYPNLFVQYRKNNDWFNLNITLLDLGGAEYVNH